MSLREFFYFQKSDRKVLVVAFCVMAVALGVVYLVGNGNSTTPMETADSTALGGAGEEPATASGSYYAVEEQPRHLVPFDPNTADSTCLLGLGLQPWQVRSIYRYRAKGGVFRQPSDFARVYGLTVKQYRELQPYIRISDDYRPAAEVYGQRNRGSRAYISHSGSATGVYPSHEVPQGRGLSESPSHTPSRDTLRYPVKLRAGEHIDLNSADTTLLKRVPGIGSYYARKVVAYRQQLGGFYSTDQLFEIEGFPEDAVDFFTMTTGITHRLKINQLSLAQLRKHPYINFYQAKAITDYRRLKGPLTSLNQLSLLPDFPPEVITRLAPYVEF